MRFVLAMIAGRVESMGSLRRLVTSSSYFDWKCQVHFEPFARGWEDGPLFGGAYVFVIARFLIHHHYLWRRVASRGRRLRAEGREEGGVGPRADRRRPARVVA